MLARIQAGSQFSGREVSQAKMHDSGLDFGSLVFLARVLWRLAAGDSSDQRAVSPVVNLGIAGETPAPNSSQQFREFDLPFVKRVVRRPAGPGHGNLVVLPSEIA